MQSASRVDLAQERLGLGATGTAPLRPCHLGGGKLEQALAQIVPRQGEGILDPGRHDRRLGWGQFLEEIVERAGIEGEFPAQRLQPDFRRHVGRDRDRRVLVLQVDREREFLRHVVRLEFERPLRFPERALEVAQLAQREAQVIVRCREARVVLHRAAEGIPGITVPLELHQHEPDAVPCDRIGMIAREHLAVRLERRLGLAPLHEYQREVEPRRMEAGLPLERRPERGHGRLGAGRAGPEDTEVVPCQGVRAVGGDRLLVRGGSLVATSGLVQAHAPLVPDLRDPRVLPQQFVVELECRHMIAAQQVDLRHRLQHEGAILPRLECHAILAQRLGEVALLPERKPELVVCERVPLQRLPAGIISRAACPPPLPAFAASSLFGTSRSSDRFACARDNIGLSAMARLVASSARSCSPMSPYTNASR